MTHRRNWISDAAELGRQVIEREEEIADGSRAISIPHYLFGFWSFYGALLAKAQQDFGACSWY